MKSKTNNIHNNNVKQLKDEDLKNKMSLIFK